MRILFVLFFCFSCYAIDTANTIYNFTAGTAARAAQVLGNDDSLQIAINKMVDTINNNIPRFNTLQDSNLIFDSITVNIITGDSAYIGWLNPDTLAALILTGKLTAGATEIEGSNFDINGADISAATVSGGLTWSAAQDMNNQALTNVNIDGGDISASTISGGLTWSAAQDLNNQDLTNIDVNSGAIDGTTIGAASATTGVFTTLNTSSIDVDTIRADGASGLFLFDDGNNGIFIEDGGGVGINNTNPIAALEISDQGENTSKVITYFTNSDTPSVSEAGQTALVRFGVKGTNNNGASFTSASTALIEGGKEQDYYGSGTADWDGFMSLKTYNNGSPNEVIRLTSEQLVGIDTTTPGSKLHVAGSIRARDTIFADVYSVDTSTFVKQRFTPVTQTISSNSVTVTGNLMILTSEAGAGADTIDTMIGGLLHDVVYLMISEASGDIVLIDPPENNIVLNADRTLTSASSLIVLMKYDASPEDWVEIIFNGL